MLEFLEVKLIYWKLSWFTDSLTCLPPFTSVYLRLPNLLRLLRLLRLLFTIYSVYSIYSVYDLLRLLRLAFTPFTPFTPFRVTQLKSFIEEN